MSITKSTGSYSDNVKRLKEALSAADSVVIGAGAGLSTSAGFTYSGERFHKYFADFEDKYGFHDMYSG
ncbi:MAG: Sir2 silent information regulator family NAD-dependent deacetylase, partial [Lachnospiraceae bacterium]|nr:Sir2 silent information regulator family NAD-dependent deacetylase [Lachnospiraceae bacterium]